MRTETKHRDLFLLQCLCGAEVCDEAAKTPQQDSGALISMWECYNCAAATIRSRSFNKLHLCTFLYMPVLSQPPSKSCVQTCGRARWIVWLANRLIVIATRAETVMEPCVCRE